MHVLSVEVWVILKVIVLRIKVLRVGKLAVFQEFVLGAGRATTGLECVSPSPTLWAVHCRETRGEANPGPEIPTASSLWGLDQNLCLGFIIFSRSLNLFQPQPAFQKYPVQVGHRPAYNTYVGL